jgi:O-antigen/teichoic acid export membrane protein
MSARSQRESFALHALGALVSQASGILSAAVLAGIGSLALLGEIGLATASGIFLSSVFTASLALATNIIVAREHRKSLECAAAVSMTLLRIGWAASGTAGGIAMVVSLALGERGDVNLALACAAYCAFTSINNIQMSVLRGFGDFKASSLLAIWSGALKFVILIPFIWGSRDSGQFIWAMVAGQAIANSFYRRWITKQTFRFGADLSEFKRLNFNEVRKFVVGNLPSNLLIAGYNWVCVWCLGSYAGAGEVGKWSVGQRLINVIIFLPRRFADVNLTHLSRNGSGTRAEAWYRGLTAAALCLLFSTPMFFTAWLFGDRFGILSDALDAGSLVPFVLVAASMMLVRFRVQHDFSRFCSFYETRTAVIRMLVLLLGTPALIVVGILSSDSLGYISAISYIASAIFLYCQKE